MEEQTSPIQLPFHLSASPPSPENEYAPAEEEKVVPMPIQTTITEDERRPYAAAKRKPRSTNSGKTRGVTGSKKTLKAARQSQSTPPYHYADEVKQFEDYANRINQILVDRANPDLAKEADAIAECSSNLAAHPQPISETSTQPTPWQVVQPLSPDLPVKNQPIKNQWQTATPTEEQAFERLNFAPGSIHQRLHELGLSRNKVEFHAPVSDQPSGLDSENSAYSHPPSMPNAETCHSSFYPSTQATPSQIPQTAPFPNPSRGSSANRFPRDRSHSRAVSPPMTLHRYLREWRRRLSGERSRELPRQPIERLSDAALWIATFAIIRVASRYVLTVFPTLSPVFFGVMLAPAIAAVYLLVCVPKTGWIAYYRLFLIMVGFLLGSKL